MFEIRKNLDLTVINRNFQKQLGGCDDNGDPKSSTVYVVK